MSVGLNRKEYLPPYDLLSEWDEVLLGDDAALDFVGAGVDRGGPQKQLASREARRVFGRIGR